MNRREFLAASIASSAALASRAAEPARKLRVAVIGHTGRGNYGHGLDTMWLRLPETEIVGVADADEKGLAAEVKKLKLARGCADYRAMLAETKPDIVAIAPRFVDEHRDMALAAVEAGARGIYSEKPFCRTPAEADEIVAACERRQVKLALAHVGRYHPVLPVVERLLREGGIGRLLELRARGKEDSRGGALDLWVLGSHVLNLATYFGGKPLACSATLLQGGRPVVRGDVKDGDEGVGPLAGNEVHARFEMERGVPLFFDSVQGAGEKGTGFGLQLVGTKGIVDVRSDKEPLVQLLAGSPFLPGRPRIWVPISSAGLGKPEPLAEVKETGNRHLFAGRDLIAAMRENRAPLCSALDGRVVVEMICAVFESHRLNGQHVTFPLKTRQNPLAMLG
ncbi:MAG: Gfo/Idh/MocA family oxidoreductase [Verrucomicrobia bacterium]|nr:Gfo/Idh/MocA family oxidoreductase [Verrucomicrobiota bacterium]